MPQASTLEERVSHVEQDLAALKSQLERLRPQENWMDQTNAPAKGGEPAGADFPQRANPWLSGAGMFRDDPLFDEWQTAIAEYRREVNGNVDAP